MERILEIRLPSSTHGPIGPVDDDGAVPTPPSVETGDVRPSGMCGAGPSVSGGAHLYVLGNVRPDGMGGTSPWHV
jgi:hypothetical protein